MKILFTKRDGRVCIVQPTLVNRGIHLWMGWSALELWIWSRFNDRFYVHTNDGVAQSVDNGESWTTVPVNASAPVRELSERELPDNNFYTDSKLVVADDGLYGIAAERDNLRISRLSVGDNMLVPFQGIPAFDGKDLSRCGVGRDPASTRCLLF